MDACPTGASHIQEGGVVMVNPQKCTGCKACITSCAYGARYVHPAGYVDKCTFCLHRVKKGEPTACVEVCPTRSLTFGDLNDPDSAVSRRKASPLDYGVLTELNTRPRTTYEARLRNPNPEIGEV